MDYTLETLTVENGDRIRLEPEDLAPRDCYDEEEESKHADNVIERIESGRYVWVCAVHERLCGACGQWEHVDSVGAIAADDYAGAFDCAREYFDFTH